MGQGSMYSRNGGWSNWDLGTLCNGVVEGEQIVIEQKMKKMTARFPKRRGWDDTEIPASIMMSHLEPLVPDLAVDQLNAG